MRVEIWADVVCPWCYVGKRRFAKALAAFPHADQVEVVERSFQLDPSHPPGRGMPVREMLRRKYGMGDNQLRATTEHLAQLAAAEGIPAFHAANNVTGNTRLAHELIAFAHAHDKRDAAWDRLYHAYFGEGLPVYEVDALLPFAADLGLDIAEARRALETGAHRAEVDADLADARAIGVRGVPFFVFDRQLAVSGAQPRETFDQVLAQAWQRRPASVPDAAACGDEACETGE